jgi:hypothetical protein
MKIMIALVLLLGCAGSAYADSIQQVTLPSGKNCQVVTIAGQTYINC